jgi:hypothetical protein
MYEKSLIHILWQEKLKATQKVIDVVSSLTEKQLDFRTDAQEWSIRSNLMFVIFLDRALEFSLPLSLNLGALLQFRELRMDEVEKELLEVSMDHEAAVFLPDLESIHINSAKELDTKEKAGALHDYFQSWQGTLVSIEENLRKIKFPNEFSQRLISIKGIHSLPAGLEMYLVYSHKLIKDGIIKQISNSNFPQGTNV